MSMEMNKALYLLHGLVREVERKTCCHEETHRGGAIWEICDSCGAKWADDEGGKPEFAWPESVEKARAFLATHHAVEQAGGDERVIGWRERILAAHPNSDPGFWPDALLVEHMAAEIADLRAALAQPSPKSGDYSDQSWINAGCPPEQPEQAEAERPEVFGLERYRVERTGQGFWPYCVRAGDGTRELFVGHLKQCKRVAAQLATAFEDGKFVAGALRAENTKLSEALDECDGDRWKLRSERDAANARLHEVATACATAEQQRDAALARVAELERQVPVAWMHDQPNRVDVIHRDVKDLLQRVPGSSRGIHRPLDVSEHYTIPLYAAPVAQAQQLNDLDKQCRDDVARALGLRPNQERGFAWSYLLASIKSCVKASGDSAQAQHSVPEEFIGRLSEFLAQRGATGKALLRELRDMLAAAPARGQHSVPAYVNYTTRPAESLAGIALRQLKDESRWVEIRDINAHAFPDMQSHSYYPAGTVIKLPAAAPGKEVGHE